MRLALSWGRCRKRPRKGIRGARRSVSKSLNGPALAFDTHSSAITMAASGHWPMRKAPVTATANAMARAIAIASRCWRERLAEAKKARDRFVDAGRPQAVQEEAGALEIETERA